jgi:hypothetical protein
VAVHSLNPLGSDSNAMTTWTASNGKAWITDVEFLPGKVPNAWIMVLEYNLNPSFTSSRAGLNDQAKASCIGQDSSVS